MSYFKGNLRAFASQAGKDKLPCTITCVSLHCSSYLKYVCHIQFNHICSDFRVNYLMKSSRDTALLIYFMMQHESSHRLVNGMKPYPLMPAC